ncbi:hypothetical protein HK103_004150 [Boothiomyces macroporosus]|uniref:Uncharacterized protein n=1 Tax=Boothiomyces macroporosus TaxID=261099 RepID=A0AAD5UH62_9FUNG|nr:hypothetical protein HK103_004150 [Boothiomyces macroporosus]
MNKKLVEFNNQFFNKAQEFKEYKLLIKQLQLLAKKKQLLQHYYDDLEHNEDCLKGNHVENKDFNHSIGVGESDGMNGSDGIDYRDFSMVENYSEENLFLGSNNDQGSQPKGLGLDRAIVEIPGVDSNHMEGREQTVEGRQTPVLEQTVEGRQTPVLEQTVEGRQTPVLEQTVEGRQTPVLEKTVEGRQTPVLEKTVEGREENDKNLQNCQEKEKNSESMQAYKPALESKEQRNTISGNKSENKEITETRLKLKELGDVEQEISCKLNKFNLKELEFISKSLSLIKSPIIEIVSESNINSSIFTYSYFIQNITHISIKTGSVSTRDFELLIDFIETRKLQYLKLINQVDLFNYSSISLQDILKRINFFKCRINELSLVDLMQDNYQIRLPKFKKLELVNMSLNDSDLHNIDFSGCEALTLKSNFFTEKGLQRIITSKLKNINISNQFCTVCFMVFDHLEKIEFDSISFTDKETDYLQKGVSKSRVESLSLRDCGVTLNGLKKILIKTKYLQHLQLSNLIYTRIEIEKKGNKYQPTFDEIKESFQIERHAVLLVSEYIKTSKLVSLLFHIKGEYYTFMTLMYDCIKLNKTITNLNDQWSFCKGFIKQNQTNQVQRLIQLTINIRCLKMLGIDRDLRDIVAEEFLIGLVPLKYKRTVFKLFDRFGLRYRNLPEFIDQLLEI